MEYAEILSPSKAMQIVRRANDAMQHCVRTIASRTSEFAEIVSQYWEDENAVNSFKGLRDTMTDVVHSLDRNNRAFGETVQNISNSYADIGHMPRIAVETVSLSVDIDVSAVKATFSQSEDSDTFGFKDLYTSPSIIMENYASLEKDLLQIAETTVGDLKAIPAFGNTTINKLLAENAGKVINTVINAINVIKTRVENGISQTSQAYFTAGINAANEAAITGSSETNTNDGVNTTPAGPLTSPNYDTAGGANTEGLRTPMAPHVYGGPDSVGTTQRVSVEPIRSNPSATEGGSNAVYNSPARGSYEGLAGSDSSVSID